MSRIIGISLLLFWFTQSSHAAVQGLDQAMARKSRYGTATLYTGESTSPYNFIQPETLNYTDVTTGKEAWRLAFRPGSKDTIGGEHGLDGVWGADGSRIMIKNVPNSRASTSVQYGYDWILSPDGSKMRKAAIGARSQNPSYGGLGWTNTQPNVIYRYQSSTSGGIYKGDQLWKWTLDENNGPTGEMILNLNGAAGGGPGESIKNAISGNDKYIVGLTDSGVACPECPNPINTRYLYWTDLDTGLVARKWGIARNCGPSADPYGDHLPAYENTAHAGSVWAIGPNADSVIVQYGTGGNMWQLVRDGHYADGGPTWEDWNGDSFGTNEDIKIVSDGSGTPDNPYGNIYWGHPAFDKWGTKAIIGDYEDVGNGTRIIERSNNWGLRTGHVANAGQYDNGHHSWAGWTDWVVANQNTGDLIYTNVYTDSTNSPVSVVDVVRPTMTGMDYSAYPRPVQSPDGTKIAFHTVMFHSAYAGTATDDDAFGVSIGVAYYPHPPEITSVTGSGTYTIRFDWRTDQTTSRGYTQRGWPDEATNDPPPPRETSKFRLWRSSDNVTWTPISTVDAAIFERYNFKTGAWSGNNYWTITDTPGAGTFYYAVTAVEHSGLESRVKSNVFNTAGTQTAAYPVDPKAATKVTSTYQPTLIRHYNIYAADGSAPAISQTTRIASIPVASGTSYVDWLGDPGGTTQYKVTAVDTQGNESAALSSTSAAKATPGQYDVSWTSEVPEDACDSSHLNLCTIDNCTGAGGYWYNALCNATPQPATPTKYRLNASKPTRVTNSPPQ
jgi:hypothetical protein